MGATMVGEELKILREHLWAIQVFGERKEIHFHHQPVDHHALLQCHSQQLPPTLGKVVFSRYVTTVGEYFDLMNFTAEIVLIQGGATQYQHGSPHVPLKPAKRSATPDHMLNDQVADPQLAGNSSLTLFQGRGRDATAWASL